MARGFGATFGAGATDKVVSGFTTNRPTKRCIGIWMFRNGAGGGGLGRLWDKRSGADGQIDLCLHSSTTVLQFEVDTSGTASIANAVMPSISTWHHILHCLDTTSVGTAPQIYIDGVLQGGTGGNGWTGTPLNTTSPYTAGNRDSDNARNWDGKLAWFSVWDGVILGAGEAMALFRGALPFRVQPASLVCCMPMWGKAAAEPDLGKHSAAAVTGTAFQPDPPMGLFTPRFNSDLLPGGAAFVPSPSVGLIGAAHAEM